MVYICFHVSSFIEHIRLPSYLNQHLRTIRSLLHSLVGLTIFKGVSYRRLVNQVHQSLVMGTLSCRATMGTNNLGVTSFLSQGRPLSPVRTLHPH